MPKVTGTKSNSTPWTAFFVDLMIYLVVMFGVGELYVSGLGFIANAHLMSFVTLIVASWRMRDRGVIWRDLGLRKPDSLKKTLIARGGILAMAVGGIILLEIIKDPLFFEHWRACL